MHSYYEDKKSITNTTTSSSSNFSLYKPVKIAKKSAFFFEMSAEHFLTLVVDAEEFGLALKNIPELMSCKTSVLDKANRYFNTVSAFEYVIWARDVKSCKTMLDAIPRNTYGLKLIDELISQHKTLLKKGIPTYVETVIIKRVAYDKKGLFILEELVNQNKKLLNQGCDYRLGIVETKELLTNGIKEVEVKMVAVVTRVEKLFNFENSIIKALQDYLNLFPGLIHRKWKTVDEETQAKNKWLNVGKAQALLPYYVANDYYSVNNWPETRAKLGIKTALYVHVDKNRSLATRLWSGLYGDNLAQEDRLCCIAKDLEHLKTHCQEGKHYFSRLGKRLLSLKQDIEQSLQSSISLGPK